MFRKVINFMRSQLQDVEEQSFKIDPTQKLDPEQAYLLDLLLKKCKRKGYLETNVIYTMNYTDAKGVKRTARVELTHEIYHRLTEPKEGKPQEDRYEVVSKEKKLGKGTFGEVYRILGTIEPLKYGGFKFKQYVPRVIKFIEHEKMMAESKITKEKVIKAIQKEVRTMQDLEHTGAKQPLRFEEESAIIMHKLGDQDFDSIIDHQKIGEETLTTLDYFDLTINLLKTHVTQNIQHDKLHRDIKPANVTRDSDTGEIFFLDYGLSTSKDNPDTNICGTPLYMAPEVLKGLKQTPAVDIYSLGIFISQLWGADYSKFTQKDVDDRKSGKFKLPKLFGNIKGLSEDDIKLIQSQIMNMLTYKPEDRITAEKSIENFEEARLKYLFRIKNCDGERQEQVRKAITLAKSDKLLFEQASDQFNVHLENIRKKLTLSLQQIADDNPLALKEYVRALGIKQLENVEKDNIPDTVDNIVKDFNEHVEYLKKMASETNAYINKFHTMLNNYNPDVVFKELRTNPELQNLYMDLQHLSIDVNKQLDKLKTGNLSFTTILQFEKKFPPRTASFKELSDDISAYFSRLEEVKIRSIQNLQNYITERKEEAKGRDDHYRHFYGRLPWVGGFSAKQKVDAAQALIDAIQGKKKLEPEHLDALNEGNLKTVAKEALEHFKPKL